MDKLASPSIEFPDDTLYPITETEVLEAIREDFAIAAELTRDVELCEVDVAA
jgi:hypothetical protein